MPARQPHPLSFDDLLRLTESIPSEHLSRLHHLLGCRACRRLLARLLPEVAPEAVPLRAPLVSRLYQSVFQRLPERQSEYLAAFALGAAEADAEIDGLFCAPPRKRDQLFRQTDPPRAVAIVLRLLERAYEESSPYPTRGRDLASVAFGLACQLERMEVPHATQAELKARARLLEGWAWGLEHGRRPAYDQFFEWAEREIAHPDAVEAALFCRLLGSLAADDRRGAEAVALLERAERLFRDSGEATEEALAVSEQARVYAVAGDSERALSLFGRAVALKQGWTPPAEALRDRLLLALMHAVAGHPHVARGILGHAEEMAAAGELAAPSLYLLARARFAAEAGERQEAERLLGEALRSALAAGACGEAAAAVFHLAILAADAGDRAAMAALGEQMEPLLAPGTMPSHLREALRRVRDLLRAGEAPAGRFARHLRRFRERAPGAPGPFQGLTVLFDETMTAPLLRSRAKLLPFAGRTEGRGA